MRLAMALLLALGSYCGLSPHARAHEAAAPGTSVALLNESIVFYAAYDGQGPGADLAKGEPDPVKVEGQVRFVPGRFGKALLVGTGAGGARLTYASKGHLDFREPGAASLWVRPVAWTPLERGRRGYVHFLSVLSKPASFVVERMGMDEKIRRPDRLIVGAFDLPRAKHQYMEIDGTGAWSDRDWHLIVLNWDAHGFEVSLDGGAFQRRSAPSGFEADAFVRGREALPFVIGGSEAETSAIDDLTLYAHPLEPTDAVRLFGREGGSD
jgi:hypothetical protein